MAFSFLVQRVQALSIVCQKQGLLGQGGHFCFPSIRPCTASLRALCAGLSNSCRCFHALCAMLVTSHAQTKILLHSSGPHRRIRREAIKDAGKLTLAVASDQVSSLTQATPATQELAISVNSLGVGFGTANSRKQVSLLGQPVLPELTPFWQVFPAFPFITIYTAQSPCISFLWSHTCPASRC